MYRSRWMLFGLLLVSGWVGCAPGAISTAGSADTKNLVAPDGDPDDCESVSDVAKSLGWEMSCQRHPPAAGYLAFTPTLSPATEEPTPSELFLQAAMPSALDWRNNNGNFVTPARNQGACGSCWAFAVTAALESAVLRSTLVPVSGLNLSEQAVVSCSGAGSCNGGIAKNGTEYLISSGIPSEGVFPYQAKDLYCALGGGEAAPRYRGLRMVSLRSSIDYGRRPSTQGNVVQEMKQALNEYGPIISSMLVFNDFRYYKSGIYRHATEEMSGLHVVLVVGYSDEEGGYFIAKNSWDEWWGEKGFFRIAYSEVESWSVYQNYHLRNFGFENYAIAGATSPTFSIESGGYHGSSTLAPGQIAMGLGTSLAQEKNKATQMPLPLELDGTKLQILDSQGDVFQAALFDVSPEQVRFEVPANMREGSAKLGLTNKLGDLFTAGVEINRVAPVLYTVKPNSPFATGHALRIRQDGSQVWEPLVVTRDGVEALNPIELNPSTDTVYLVLYGTGLRNHSGLGLISARVFLGNGEDNVGEEVEVAYVGPQYEYRGLDQVNIRLPNALERRGVLHLRLTMHAMESNNVAIQLR